MDMELINRVIDRKNTRWVAMAWSVMALLFVHPADAQSLSNGPIGLQSYVGTWKYESANETVILKIRDTMAYDAVMKYIDTCVIGTYCYIRNDSVIVDNMEMYHYNGDPIHMPIYSSLGSEDAMGNIFSLDVFFDDTKTGKTSSDCEIHYSLGHSAPQLTWHLVDEGDLIIWENFGSDDEEYNEYMRKKKIVGWSVPNNITFVKVE